jgi:hypothetical protein
MDPNVYEIDRGKDYVSYFDYACFYFNKNLAKTAFQLFLIFTLGFLCYLVPSMLIVADAVSQDLIRQTFWFQAINTSSNPTSEALHCPDLIDVDPGSTAYDSSNVECVQKLLNDCNTSNFLLVYGLGSLNVSIKGKNGDNTMCQLALTQETEMGAGISYSCSVPEEKTVNWRSWRNANGLGALDDILPYCTKQG